MTPLLRLPAWLCVGVLLVPSWGCPRQRGARSPREAVQSFGAALARGRLESAYGQLSSAQRATLSLEDFKKQIKENPGEAKALSRASSRPLTVRVEADVELADGRHLRLTQDGDGFRINQAVTDFYPRRTPRQALVSFVRAVEAERWDVLFDSMPQVDREGLDPRQLAARIAPQLEELTRIAALLRMHLDAVIEIVGDRATMPYGEGATMRFVRESDGWKVEEPE